MASNYETLDDEIKELLENYKHKRSSVYEPCKIGNIKECLIGLREVSVRRDFFFSAQHVDFRLH